MLKVWLEKIFLENSDDVLVKALRDGWNPENMMEHAIPSLSTDGVGGEAYDGYRFGLTSACADVVIVQEVDGEPKVPMILRAKPPFGKCWWIMGGAIFNYRSVHQFVSWKAVKETGLFQGSIEDFINESDSNFGITVVGLLGDYRTPADDTEGTGKVCDTINLCYMAVCDPNVELHHDKDHSAVKWFSEEDLKAEDPCGHWYPAHVARRAIQIYKKAMA